MDSFYSRNALSKSIQSISFAWKSIGAESTKEHFPHAKRRNILFHSSIHTVSSSSLGNAWRRLQ